MFMASVSTFVALWIGACLWINTHPWGHGAWIGAITILPGYIASLVNWTRH